MDVGVARAVDSGREPSKGPPKVIRPSRGRFTIVLMATGAVESVFHSVSICCPGDLPAGARATASVNWAWLGALIRPLSLSLAASRHGQRRTSEVPVIRRTICRRAHRAGRNSAAAAAAADAMEAAACVSNRGPPAKTRGCDLLTEDAYV
ncbi:hypothetical protein HPB50_021441 [Hyalomma asiaticum]|uniref:Uncharacterized protein n=1 Tax=Hyalomma asiaticum TaxID=266040 RepID=A0ACB7TNJ6_HYAAI|nr:hypothetical protein HPB50_021441 [Hyalomma asiaticum]